MEPFDDLHLLLAPTQCPGHVGGKVAPFVGKSGKGFENPLGDQITARNTNGKPVVYPQLLQQQLEA